MMREMVRQFKNPTSAYRGKPFWAWNGKLEPNELRRQIRIMKQMGMGGFFMHSRIGLATEYLSDDWFNMVGVCVEEAKRLDMEAWLYDEDRWPSGAAGGIVTRNPQYRMRYMSMEVIHDTSQFHWDKNDIAVFTAKLRRPRATEVRRLSRGERPRLTGGRCILRFAVKTAPMCSWYNGYTYLDTLNPDAVKAFIQVTHEAYRERFGQYFGNVIPGIFIDEPNHGMSFFSLQETNDGKSIPWTDSLPQIFNKRYGYDLLDHLPALFLDVDGQPITPARYHYHDCTTHLFVESFAAQIGQWCTKNNLLLTGHILFESMLSHQASAVGSCMRFYEHMHAPGMDLLTEYLREYDSAKQVSSSSRQSGSKWRLTETYGCTGWDFSYAGHKAVGDWQAALGLNLRSHHLAWYTMEGATKRDYPASISYQSPWYDSYHLVEDYFSRIHTITTRGHDRRDLLVIHPVESSWVLCREGWARGWSTAKHTQDHDHLIVKLRDTLLAANIDFDYADEEVLGRLGKVSNRAAKATLQINQAKYHSVLVPPMTTMRETTLTLLKSFKAAGGEVIFAGDVAGYINAASDHAAIDFSKDCTTAPARGPALVRAVEAGCRLVSITDETGKQIVPVLHLLREDKRAYYLFICNVGHDFRRTVEDIAIDKRRSVFKQVHIHLLADYRGIPLELDPLTGECFRADTRKQGDGHVIHTSLPELGSRLFVFPKEEQEVSGLTKRRAQTEVSRREVNRKRWPIRLSECNNLVLDRANYRIGTGAWRGEKDILRIDRAVRASLGLSARAWHMIQPWAEKVPSPNSPRKRVTLRYNLLIDTMPSGDLYLAIEQPDRYELSVNGKHVPTDTDCGWWTDRSLRKISLPAYLLGLGENQIDLSVEYDAKHPGLEAIHLLGDFGTRVRDTTVAVTDPPTTLRLGDWTGQGLDFYSGSVLYQTTINPKALARSRWYLAIPDFKGVAVRVTVNGRTAGIVGWQPYEVDITDWVTGEAIELGIEIIGHRRNSHGPLHLADTSPRFIGPIEFETTGRKWRDDYSVVPMGLIKPPVLINRK